MRDTFRILILMAFLDAGSALQADISWGLPAPPQADAVTAHTLGGGEVTISLRGHYGAGGAVSFWIVRQPAHGKLSALKSFDNNSATISYQHDGSAAPSTDGFSYIIQAGGRVSAAAEVRITIDEPPARLRTTDRIDFGTVMAGGNASRPLIISNDGGGILEGRVTASSPWQLSAPEYRIPAGQSVTITVGFWPNEAKDFVGQVTLDGAQGGETIVSLGGTGSAPIAITPNPVLLGNLEEGSAARRAVIFLANRADRAFGLDFQASAKFKRIDPIVLEGKEERDITIELQPEVHAPLDETIAVNGPGFTLPLRVEATASSPAPILKAQTSTTGKILSTLNASASAAPLPSAAQAASRTPRFASETPSSPAAIALVPVSARRLDASRWELSWPAPKEPNVTYRIDERSLSLDATHELKSEWRELAHGKTSATQEKVAMQVEGLSAHELHVLRVTAVNADGTTLWESPAVSLPPIAEHSRGRNYLLLLFGLLLVGFLFLRWRGNRLSA